MAASDTTTETDEQQAETQSLAGVYELLNADVGALAEHDAIEQVFARACANGDVTTAHVRDFRDALPAAGFDPDAPGNTDCARVILKGAGYAEAATEAVYQDLAQTEARIDLLERAVDDLREQASETRDEYERLSDLTGVEVSTDV